MGDPKPYRWLGDPKERQHVFVAESEQSLCHMVALGPQFARHPGLLRCFWCKGRLRSLKERHKLDLQETL